MSSNKEISKIRFGFKSENQAPLFMVWREYQQNGEVVGCRCLFEIWDRKTALRFNLKRRIFIWTKYRSKYGYKMKP